MLNSFKRIIVPENAAVVVSSDSDANLEVVIPEPAEHECGENCDCGTGAIGLGIPRVTKECYPELSERFLLAGRALFTVSNPKGEHYTFKVRGAESEWPAGSGKKSTTHFVSIKAPGGEFPFRYIGLLNTKEGTIKCTAKSAFLPGSKEYDIAAWACQAIIKIRLIPDGYHIENAGQCGKCSRVLTDPESIARGIGPECWKMIS